MNKNKGKGTSHLRKKLTHNRKMMANLSAFDKEVGGPTERGSYLRSSQKRNNYGSAGYYHPPVASVTQIPALSTRLNDYCFDFGEKNYNRMDYGMTNGTSKFSPNQRYKKFGRGVSRTTPYHVPVPNREPQQNHLAGVSRECAQQKKVTDEPKQDLQNVWKIDNRSKTVPKAAPPQSAADNTLKGISNFIKPSPWYPGAKNLESSYRKNEPESKLFSKYSALDKTPSKYSTWDKSLPKYSTLDKPPSKYSTLNKPVSQYSTSDNPYYGQNVNRNSVAGKWDTSKNVIHDMKNGTDYTDDLYPNVIEEPMKNKWVVPPELNQSIASGIFYTKVCEAVLEKVLQQLCPNSYKVNQRSGSTSYNPQSQANHSFYSTKNMTDSFSRYPRSDAVNFKLNEPIQNQDTQQLRYNPYYKNYKKYAPKPVYHQPFRGINSGKITKRKILTKNQESLV